MRASILWLAAMTCTGCTKKGGTVTLEEQLRSIEKGQRFTVLQFIPDGWMREATWEVHQASHIDSSRPMGPNGQRCRAHGFLLTEENTVLGVVAIECGGTLIPTADGQLSITWPLYAHPENDLRLELRFVDALTPEHDVLWVTETSVGDGDLTAMEYAYRVSPSSRIETILQTVGADPAAYGDETPDVNHRQSDEVRASYRSAFRGPQHPQTFVITKTYRGLPSDMRYVFMNGTYEWDSSR